MVQYGTQEFSEYKRLAPGWLAADQRLNGSKAQK
jgi:hypothetical protein